MRNAAIKFRGKLYFGEYHADCLQDLIEDPCWPESHAELADIIDDRPELLDFGREGPNKTFIALAPMDNSVRREWYSKSL